MKVGDLIRVRVHAHERRPRDGQLGVIVGTGCTRQWKVRLIDGELFWLYDDELEAVNESR